MICFGVGFGTVVKGRGIIPVDLFGEGGTGGCARVSSRGAASVVGDDEGRGSWAGMGVPWPRLSWTFSIVAVAVVARAGAVVAV